VLSVLLFGLAPALQTTRTDLVPALKAAMPNGPAKRRLWGRNALVSGQIAVTLVLLVVASMVFRAFRTYMGAGPGFRTTHLLFMRFDPSLVRSDDARTQRFYKYLRDRAPLVAGVESATLASAVPMSPGQDQKSLVPEGYQLPTGQEKLNVFSDTVDERYFSTMGIDVIRGRGFLETDTANTPRVAVINREMARRYWPNQDAIGRRFRLGDRNGPWVQVVGVAKTTKYFFIAEPPMPFFYLPFSQNFQAQMTLITESRGAAAALTAPLREMVRQFDPSLPVFDVRTMEDFYKQRAVDVPNMLIETVGFLGLMGLALAVVGLYGLVAYSVSCRTREIGIRMAIGASQASVLRLVLRQGLVLAGIGVAIGLVISALAGQVVMSAFYTARFDMLSYLLVPVVLIAVTLIASSIPARRASQIDPTSALRFE
jgi:predicted permease